MFLKDESLQLFRRTVSKPSSIFLSRLRRLLDKIQGKRFVHLLHIGKTGGTAVKHALAPFLTNGQTVICLHSHGCRLRDIPPGEGVVFFLRDPIARFVSGFHSRQRQGQPRYFFPWSAEERCAFSYFDTPNKLAVCLSSEDGKERLMAEEAMKGIVHVKSHYWDWFEDERYFLSRLEDIVFVGYQESLGEDFQQLKQLLHIPHCACLPHDDVNSHRSPAQVDKSLNIQAVKNLRHWYREDYRFIDICRTVFTGR